MFLCVCVFFFFFCFFFVFFVFYSIKISKFALPGVMLMYERTSKDRKIDAGPEPTHKEKMRAPPWGFLVVFHFPLWCLGSGVRV